jgi:hypothetical protein
MLYWRRRSKLLAQNLNSSSKTCCKIGCLVGDIIFGTNILPSVPDAVGLNHFGVELPSKETFDETMKHISQYDGANVEEKSSSPQARSNSVLLQDTDGITIRIYGKDDSSSNNND